MMIVALAVSLGLNAILALAVWYLRRELRRTWDEYDA